MKTIRVDYSKHVQLELYGSDRKSFLHGMCTSQIKEMKPGEWLYTSSLNAKGKVRATFDVLAFEECLLLVADPSVGDKLHDMFDSHIIADDVELKTCEHDLYKEWTDVSSVWTAKLIKGKCAEAFSEKEEIDCRRIEAGFPFYDQDVNEGYFPFESGLETFIDYKKGCYLGQEPVARVKYKGEPKKTLCGLKFVGGECPAPGSPIEHAEKPKAGVVTSTVVSPDFGPIALGYVYKSIFSAGSAVTVDGKEATLVALPFG